MAFSTITGNAWELIDAWATAMIATGSWEDADPALKADGTTDPAGRALRYTRPGEEIYVTLVHAYMGYSGTGSARYLQEAALVFVSSGWDALSHIPSGTIETTYVPLSYSGAWAYPTGTPRPTTSEAQWWISASADIWSIMTISGNSSRTESIGFISFEREAAKEYDDGGSNVFIYADMALVRWNYTSGDYDYCAIGGSPYAWSLPSAWSGLRNGAIMRKYIHPFTASYPTSRVSSMSSASSFIDGQDKAYSYLIVPTRATKSLGNSKVYMAFPTAFADPGTWRSPIKSLKGFFPVTPGAGIADGDLISIPVSWNGLPPVTCRYIYKALASPDGAQLDVAVYYDEPV